MAAFEYRQAQEIRDAFKRHGVKYLFIGESGATLLGYPDTTQDADLFIEKNASNCEMLVQSLHDIGFQVTDRQAQEVTKNRRPAAFIPQLAEKSEVETDVEGLIAIGGPHNTLRDPVRATRRHVKLGGIANSGSCACSANWARP